MFKTESDDRRVKITGSARMGEPPMRSLKYTAIFVGLIIAYFLILINVDFGEHNELAPVVVIIAFLMIGHILRIAHRRK